MPARKKYSELDLIEKHRVNIWFNTRRRLQQHLELLNKKLEQYDLSDMPAPQAPDDANLGDLERLLGKLERGD